MLSMRTSCPQLAIVALLGSLAAGFSGSASADIQYTGVNLSGAEFGQGSLPGVYNGVGPGPYHYVYPNSPGTSNEIGYFTGKGMNTFRLPFRWERLVRRTGSAPYAPLTYSAAETLGLDPTELGRMDAFVNAATAAGAYTILDPHNFQRYFNPPGPGGEDYQTSSSYVIGSSNVPYNSGSPSGQRSAFDSLWKRLADHYKDNDHVIFNLMNEPNSMVSANLVAQENSAIAAIRATGASNLILVPGSAWTGAWSWADSNEDTPGVQGGYSGYDQLNAVSMLNVVDPGNNFAFDMHQYFDTNSSGTSNGIKNNDPNIGVQRLTLATQWLKANDRRAFLGEFAVDDSRIGTGGTQVGDELLHNLLTYMEQNSDVWLGWAWWGGGPWWSTSSLFYIDPISGVDQPMIPILQQYLAGDLGDMDDDGNVDADDIDVLWHKIRGTGVDPNNNDAGDIDGDTLTDVDDLDALLALLETTYGDADLDGDVDGADFDAWRIRDSLGGGIGWATGDFDGDNDVDGADFDLWRERPAAIGGGEGFAAVPEPSTLALLATALLMGGMFSLRRAA